MPESFFAELKRYVRFDERDERALRAFGPHAAPHFARIADEFYDRVLEHDAARNVFEGPEQVERLKLSLQSWMGLLFAGPWDEAYFERRARIGRVHVRIGLQQRYMFGAMDVIRVALVAVAHQALPVKSERVALLEAFHKIVDIELAIMLETYREAFVEKVQQYERMARGELERQLAMSEARYGEIVEKGEALVSTFDEHGKIALFNRRCEEVTGLSRAAAAERSWFDLFGGERDRTLVQELVREAASGKRVSSYEGTVVTGNGADHRVRWHFTTLPGVEGPSLCAIGIDVTEEHDLAVRTRRAERLAALGTMAAGLAHEIRNPLNAAHIQLTVAQRRLSRMPSGDQENVRSAIELADGEMKRLAGLVEDFLQFARPQPLRLSTADLRAIAEATVELMAPEAAAVGVIVVLEPDAPLLVELDPERMKQVLLNLIRNAIEAAGPGGQVRVRTRAEGSHAWLEVEDDGPGFPSDAPIFEPFFTTKDSGTGLGLAIVHRIVADHGGSIDVESRPGRTVISISLPNRARAASSV